MGGRRVDMPPAGKRRAVDRQAACGHRIICVQRNSAIVLPGPAMRHRGVPDLGRAAAMLGRGDTVEDAVARGAEVIGFQLDRRETRRTRRQVHDAAVAAAGVGQRDDAAGVQVAVRRHQRPRDGKLGAHLRAVRLRDRDAEMAGQAVGAHLVELGDGRRRSGGGHGDMCRRWWTALRSVGGQPHFAAARSTTSSSWFECPQLLRPPRIGPAPAQPVGVSPRSVAPRLTRLPSRRIVASWRCRPGRPTAFPASLHVCEKVPR